MIDALNAFELEEMAPKRRGRPPKPRPILVGPPKPHLPIAPEHRYGASPISERNLHSDRYMAEVRDKIPELLHHYFDFPSDYAEGGRVPHVVQLIRDMFGGGRLLAEWATDHGKSLAGTKFFPILSLMENPDESHIVVGANIDDAKRRLIDVRFELEENHELLADFPWLKQPTKDGVIWSAKQFTVAGRSASRPNPSYYAATIGSNDIRGRRGKMIMDDIESDKVRFHANLRRQLKEFIGKAALRTFEDAHESARPLSIALGTPMDNDSVYFWLEKQMDWKVSKLSAYSVEWPRIYGYAAGERDITWQEAGARIPDAHFSWPLKREKILSQDPHFGRGQTRADFSLNYLLDPSAGDPTRLSLEQIEKFCREAEVPSAEDWLTLVCFDPASGSDSRWADYSGISVVQIRWPRENGVPAKLPQLQVLEAYQFTQGIIEQVNFIGDLARQYNCKVLYETNSQQGSNYLNAFRHHQPQVQLLPHFTSRDDKLDERHGLGLGVIKTLIKSQRLKVPQSQLTSEGMQAWWLEVQNLGTDKGADHISMSVWFAVRYLFTQISAYSAPVVLPTAGGRFFGGRGPLSWSTWRRQ